MVLSVSNTKATESSLSNVDGTQSLQDTTNTVTDNTGPSALLDVPDNVSLNETSDRLVDQQSPAVPSHVIPHHRSQLNPSALPFVPRRNAPPDSRESRVQPPRSREKPSWQIECSWLFQSFDQCVQ